MQTASPIRTMPLVLSADFGRRAASDVAFEAASLPDPLLDVEEGLVTARKVFAGGASRDVLSLIHHFKSDATAPGALLISGMPIDPFLGPTPQNGRRSAGKTTFISEYGLLWIAQELGELFAFAEEKDGDYIHNAAPNPEKKDSRSNEGSGHLSFHIEVAVSQFRPDFIVLSCVRADREASAITYSADVADAMPYLSRAAIDELYREQFVLDAPESFGIAHSDRIAVLSGPESAPELRVNFDRMSATTDAACSALSELDCALHLPQVLRQVRLRRGDMLVINNRKAAHARSPFAAHFDGYDRWLQRVYVAASLWPMREVRQASTRILSMRGDYE